MNLSAGKPVETGIEVQSIDASKYVTKLMDEKFNGYLCVTIHGKEGLEEGVIVFNEGSIVSSNYDYYKFNKSFLAEEALERSLNALNARIGVIDLFALNSYQVQLILTLNEENNLKEVVTKDNLKIKNYFNEDYEKEVIDEAGEVTSKVDLFKKFGLTKTVAKDSTRNQLMKRAVDENKQIEETMKKVETKTTEEDDVSKRFKSLKELLKKR
jgi:hypothetical protein